MLGLVRPPLRRVTSKLREKIPPLLLTSARSPRIPLRSATPVTGMIIVRHAHCCRCLRQTLTSGSFVPILQVGKMEAPRRDMPS